MPQLSFWHRLGELLGLVANGQAPDRSPAGQFAPKGVSKAKADMIVGKGNAKDDGNNSNTLDKPDADEKTQKFDREQAMKVQLLSQQQAPTDNRRPVPTPGKDGNDNLNPNEDKCPTCGKSDSDCTCPEGGLVDNPAVSEAQRRYLNASFGHDWVKEHHFDNHGELPEKVDNAWSDAAREASIAARQASKTAYEASKSAPKTSGAIPASEKARLAVGAADQAHFHGEGTGKGATDSGALANHMEASRQHRGAAAAHEKSGHVEASNAHREAEVLHQDAASEYRDRIPVKNANPEGHNQYTSSAAGRATSEARGASKDAHQYSTSLSDWAEKGEDASEYLGPSRAGQANSAAAIRAGRGGDSSLAHEFHKQAAYEHQDAAEAHRLQSGDARHEEAANMHDEASKLHLKAADMHKVSNARPGDDGRDTVKVARQKPIDIDGDDDSPGDGDDNSQRAQDVWSNLTKGKGTNNMTRVINASAPGHLDGADPSQIKAAFAAMAEGSSAGHGSAEGRAAGKASVQAHKVGTASAHKKAEDAHDKAARHLSGKGQYAAAGYHGLAAAHHRSIHKGMHGNTRVSNMIPEEVIANCGCEVTKVALIAHNAKAEGSNADTTGGSGSVQTGGEEDSDGDDTSDDYESEDEFTNKVKVKSKPLSTNEWFAMMPVEAQGVWNTAKEVHNREYKAVVNQLKAIAEHTSNPRQRSLIVNKVQKNAPLHELRQMLDLIGSTTQESGNHGVTINQGFLGTNPVAGFPADASFATNASDENDILPLPTMNYAEVAEAK